MEMPTCFIMRGLPGAGKSTLASRLGASIVSNDKFFTDENGEYKFNKDAISSAVAQCKTEFSYLLDYQQDVVVDNCNSRHWEYEWFVEKAEKAGYEVRVIEILCRNEEELRKMHERCIHNVPWEYMKTVLERWEVDERAEYVAMPLEVE